MTSRQSAPVHSAPTGLLLTPTPALTITIYITVPSPAADPKPPGGWDHVLSEHLSIPNPRPDTWHYGCTQYLFFD